MNNAYLDEEDKRSNERTALAWYIAKLVRADKIPNLNDLLIKDEEPKEMDVDQWVTALRMWCAGNGGKEVIN